MKKKIRKIGMLSSIALMVCLGVTGCYPDGKVSLEEKKETDSNQINIDENASHIEGKLDEGLFVNAQTDIKSDADWHGFIFRNISSISKNITHFVYIPAF